MVLRTQREDNERKSFVHVANEVRQSGIETGIFKDVINKEEESIHWMSCCFPLESKLHSHAKPKKMSNRTV